MKEVKEHTRTTNYPEFGRSYLYITCPFCEEQTRAYIWSLAGSGKRCDGCGALHTWKGVTIRETN